MKTILALLAIFSNPHNLVGKQAVSFRHTLPPVLVDLGWGQRPDESQASDPVGGRLASKPIKLREESRDARLSCSLRNGVPIVVAHAFKSGRPVSQEARFLAGHTR